jgi:hypothetical protein
MCTEYSNRWLHSKARWPVDKQACFTKFCPHSQGGSAKKNNVPFPWDLPISVISGVDSIFTASFVIAMYIFMGYKSDFSFWFVVNHPQWVKSFE